MIKATAHCGKYGDHPYHCVFNERIPHERFVDSLACIPKPSIFVDVGANQGLYCTSFAILGAERIVAFEANPNAMHALLLNLDYARSLGSNAWGINAAVTDRTKFSTFYYVDKPGINGGDIEPIGKSIGYAGQTHPINVVCVNASQIADLKPDVLKVDTEGCDYYVFREILPVHVPNYVITELHYPFHTKEERAKLYQLLASTYPNSVWQDNHKPVMEQDIDSPANGYDAIFWK